MATLGLFLRTSWKKLIHPVQIMFVCDADLKQKIGIILQKNTKAINQSSCYYKCPHEESCVFLLSLWVSRCAAAPLGSFSSVWSALLCVWVAFISPVSALAFLHATCPCGPQQSETLTDPPTQRGGQRVPILWIQFSRFFFFFLPVLSVDQPLVRPDS